MAVVVTDEMMASWPSDAQGVVRLLVEQNARLETLVAELEAEVADLKARLNKDSTNSSTPPSATHPHAKLTTPKPKSKRRHGGQPGHDKHERALIPVEDCRAVVPCVPSECRRCGRALHGIDPEPLRHQVWELPEIQPVVTDCNGAGRI
jgi:transposase